MNYKIIAMQNGYNWTERYLAISRSIQANMSKFSNSLPVKERRAIMAEDDRLHEVLKKDMIAFGKECSEGM